MTDFVEVEHEGVAGTAKVPASALKQMKGWTPVEAPRVELKGKALAAALRDAGLSTEGTADEKRARLVEHTNTTQES